MKKSLVQINIEFKNLTGEISVSKSDMDSEIWTRLLLSMRSLDVEYKIDAKLNDKKTSIVLSWPDTLELVRRFGSKEIQTDLCFRFVPVGEAKKKLQEFAEQVRNTRAQRKNVTDSLTEEEIRVKLKESGFTKRELKPFQMRDLSHLLSLNNGANFSVPGAGKTTVTFALHILTRQPSHNFIVISPKSAFQAWIDIVKECMDEDAPNNGAEPFTVLSGTESETSNKLNSEATRFIISYDLALRRKLAITKHFSRENNHLVLDESHHIKAGWKSKRGSFLIQIADEPVRRDILTGTPMPQSASDLGAQMDFLWPGHGFGQELSLDTPPRKVINNLFVRTTKAELGLPDKNIEFVDIDMDPGQLALYSIVRNEFLRSHSRNFDIKRQNSHFLKACKNVIRLLQLSVNPTLAISSVKNQDTVYKSGIIDSIMEEGRSAKMRAVIDKVYELTKKNEKAVVWTIFTDSVYCLKNSLADLNPVVLHGSVKSGSVEDSESREGIVKRFHTDDSCMVLIANPATAGEGINLHKVCHNAIYLDRSYISTHYLQSIDRIHRLGLRKDQKTNIFIFRSKAPPEIGSIDNSVSKSLQRKIDELEKLLNDPDLRKLALNEEDSPEPINYGIETDDIFELISELEGKKGT